MLSQVKLEEIIIGCKKTSRESQRELYKLYYGFAMATCVRYCKNDDEAKEVVNDGFLKIFNQIKNFTPAYQNLHSSFTGWMKRVFVNTSIDNYRKQSKAFAINFLEDDYKEIMDNSEQVIDKLSYKEIIGVVQQLTPTYRLVFNLHVIEGLKHEDIAEKLNISIGTSKSNLAKARHNIQKLLKLKSFSAYEQRRAI